MNQFDSRHGTITLTDERIRHIVQFHPDIKDCLPHFAKTLAEPEQEIRSVKDPLTIICYKFLPRRKKYLAIVVKTIQNPFILTAYE